MKKSTFSELLDSKIASSPLQKIPCLGCGLPTKRKDIMPEFGVCETCYAEYASDMEAKYGEARSESEEYIYAHD
jgi:hypothetical protein